MLYQTHKTMFFLQNGRDNNHPFYHIQDIWNQVEACFSDCWHFSRQTAIFGHIILIMTLFLFKITLFKLHIYNTRKNGFLSLNNFLNEISKTKNLESRTAVNIQNKCKRF